MQFLKADTAVDVLIGPFVEDGDGDSPLTALSLDVELSKNGQALTDSESAAPTHDSAGTVGGYYNCILGTTDTNTEGTLTLVVHHAEALPIRHDYMVLTQAAYDSMFGTKATGYMQVDLVTINDVATNLEMLIDADTTVVADDNLDGVVVDGSVMSHVMTTTALTDSFNATTDSLEAIGVDVDAVIAGVNVTSLAADVITPASVDEDSDFVVQKVTLGTMSVTGQADAGSVVIDDGVTIACSTENKTAIKATGGATGGHALELVGTGTGLDIDAANLNYLTGITTGVAADADLETYVPAGSIMAHLMATGADATTFLASTDSMQSIRDAITAGGDALFVPTAGAIVDGTVVPDGGNDDYTDLAADDGTRWQITLEADTPDTDIDVNVTFSLGSSRLATSVFINGYFEAAAVRACQVYAYNYTTTSWDMLSSPGASTEMRNSASDNDYEFPLTSSHTKPSATIGEVKIRFYTNSTGVDEDDLHLDYVAVTGASTGGASPQAIAGAVWTHDDGEAVARHIPKFTGKVWYVDGTNGASTNNASQPDLAIDTITGAVGLASAGDWIEVFAGTYSEAVTLAANGLELHCEIGTDIDGATGVPLTISASGCKVFGAHLIPDDGQIGCIISGDHNYLELCDSHDTGTSGFQLAATAEGNQLVRCVAQEFTGAGFDIKGFNNIFQECLARGDGGTEKGFNLSDTAAHRNLFNLCGTIDCATNGWDVDAGADDNMFNLCFDSEGCGTRVDAGANNTWRSFGDGSAVGANLAEILGTALTETSGQTAAGFKKVFDVATPVFTAESVNQAADSNVILAHADYGNAKLARTGADSDTLETLSDEIATAQTDLDSLTDAGTLSGITGPLMLDRVYTRLFHEVNVTDADGASAIRNAADDGDIATGEITDNDTTTSQAAWSWA